MFGWCKIAILFMAISLHHLYCVVWCVFFSLLPFTSASVFFFFWNYKSMSSIWKNPLFHAIAVHQMLMHFSHGNYVSSGETGPMCRIRDQVNTFVDGGSYRVRNFTWKRDQHVDLKKQKKNYVKDDNLFCANRARSSSSWTLHYFQNVCARADVFNIYAGQWSIALHTDVWVRRTWRFTIRVTFTHHSI